MKVTGILLSTILMTSGAFAGGDFTPSKRTARALAFEFANDNPPIADLLDHDSSVRVRYMYEEPNRFVFRVSAEGCTIEVQVSKETGMAWSEDTQCK